MIAKEIAILANSTKHHPMSCVAGREVFRQPDGTVRWGEWVRPVTTHDEGALSNIERRVQGGGEPRLLDILRIPLLGRTTDALQPENWLIVVGQPWQSVGSVQMRDLDTAVEDPETLWLDPTQAKTDRVTPEHLRSQENRRSLFLVRPRSFRIEVREKTWDGVTKKQLRGVFQYRTRYYDCSLRDPVASQKYCPGFPNFPVGSVEVPGAPLLCVSLTPAFEGLHYKVVATVIGAPS